MLPLLCSFFLIKKNQKIKAASKWLNFIVWVVETPWLASPLVIETYDTFC